MYTVRELPFLNQLTSNLMHDTIYGQLYRESLAIATASFQIMTFVPSHFLSVLYRITVNFDNCPIQFLVAISTWSHSRPFSS